MLDLSRAYVTPWFWDILESANFSMDALCVHLETLSDSELIEFNYEFNEALEMSTVGSDPDYENYIPWKSEDEDREFAYWLVSLGRQVYETVQINPPAVASYAALFLEGKEETLPEWTWKGEPRYMGGLTGIAEEILFERGMSNDDVFKLMEEREASPL